MSKPQAPAPSTPKIYYKKLPLTTSDQNPPFIIIETPHFSLLSHTLFFTGTVKQIIPLNVAIYDSNSQILLQNDL